MLINFVFVVVVFIRFHEVRSEQDSATCRFANSFTIDDLVYNRNDAVHRFKMNMAFWEGQFGYGAGYNHEIGITYDGHKVDYSTGDLHENLHFWTAASKEALHVNMLSLYMMDNIYARQFFRNASQDDIVDILKRKIDAYNDFHRRYPGFGGFLPWFAANGSAMNLLNGWQSKVPGLDNGQLIWSIKILIETLKSKSLLQLANEYQQRLDLMTKTAIPIFYEAERGGLRCEAGIIEMFNESLITDPKNYFTQGSCLLDDPYEGSFLQSNKLLGLNFLFQVSLWHILWIYTLHGLCTIIRLMNVIVYGFINVRVLFETNTIRVSIPLTTRHRNKLLFKKVTGFLVTNNGNTSICRIVTLICKTAYLSVVKKFAFSIRLK